MKNQENLEKIALKLKFKNYSANFSVAQVLQEWKKAMQRLLATNPHAEDSQENLSHKWKSLLGNPLASEKISESILKQVKKNLFLKQLMAWEAKEQKLLGKNAVEIEYERMLKHFGGKDSFKDHFEKVHSSTMTLSSITKLKKA